MAFRGPRQGAGAGVGPQTRGGETGMSRRAAGA